MSLAIGVGVVACFALAYNDALWKTCGRRIHRCQRMLCVACRAGAALPSALRAERSSSGVHLNYPLVICGVYERVIRIRSASMSGRQITQLAVK